MKNDMIQRPRICRYGSIEKFLISQPLLASFVWVTLVRHKVEKIFSGSQTTNYLNGTRTRRRN